MTNPSSNPLADREQRLALFQMWFSDTIPHSKALGIRIIDARRGFASMRLDWREELVGNPETGVLARGPLTGPLDGCCGRSVAGAARGMLRHGGGALAKGAQAVRHARPAHRLREAGDAGTGSDRRG